VNKDQTIATTVLAGLLKFWPQLSPTKQAFYLREMLNVIGALVEHENGFSFAKYRAIVLLCVDKIFECMESPHFQVADQALSLWKDTVMLYLSKCQKDVIWRRLFIIFKDIELNHWNQGVQNLCKEVVVYYERIDSAYWQQLKEEYALNAADTPALGDGTRNRSNDIYTLTNGGQQGQEQNERTRSNDLTTLDVAAPSTLVPHKYREDRRLQEEQRKKERVSKYKALRHRADTNKSGLAMIDRKGSPSPFGVEPEKETTANVNVNVDGDDDQKDQCPSKLDDIENHHNNDRVGDQGGGAEDTTALCPQTGQSGT